MKYNSTYLKTLPKWSTCCEVLVGLPQTGVGVFFPCDILVYFFFNADQKNRLIYHVKIQWHWRRLKSFYFQSIPVTTSRPSDSCLLRDCMSLLLKLLLRRDTP